MVSALVQKLGSERNLKKILETTVKDLGEQFRAETCQVMLTNPLDPNVTELFGLTADPAGDICIPAEKYGFGPRSEIVFRRFPCCCSTYPS